jgi:hypothetical protein
VKYCEKEGSFMRASIDSDVLAAFYTQNNDDFASKFLAKLDQKRVRNGRREAGSSLGNEVDVRQNF